MPTIALQKRDEKMQQRERSSHRSCTKTLNTDENESRHIISGQRGRSTLSAPVHCQWFWTEQPMSPQLMLLPAAIS